MAVVVEFAAVSSVNVYLYSWANLALMVDVQGHEVDLEVYLVRWLVASVFEAFMD